MLFGFLFCRCSRYNQELKRYRSERRARVLKKKHARKKKKCRLFNCLPSSVFRAFGPSKLTRADSVFHCSIFNLHIYKERPVGIHTGRTVARSLKRSPGLTRAKTTLLGLCALLLLFWPTLRATTVS